MRTRHRRGFMTVWPLNSLSESEDLRCPGETPIFKLHLCEGYARIKSQACAAQRLYNRFATIRSARPFGRMYTYIYIYNNYIVYMFMYLYLYLYLYLYVFYAYSHTHMHTCACVCVCVCVSVSGVFQRCPPPPPRSTTPKAFFLSWGTKALLATTIFVEKDSVAPWAKVCEPPPNP